MKNTLINTIHALTREEFKAFKYFLARTGGQDREDVKLVDQIRNNEYEGRLGSHNYHLITKRLKVQLEQFVSLENLKCNKHSQIINMIEVAKFMFSKNLYQLAWEYLAKAENMAVELEEYELLDSIFHTELSYSSRISISSSSVLKRIPNLLDKWEQNRLLSEADRNTNAAYAMLMYEVTELFSKKLNADISSLVNNIFKKYGLRNNIHNNPKIYSRVVNIVCWGLKEMKEYDRMKKYAIESYNFMKKEGMIDKAPADQIIDLLYEITVATLRTKDYKNCEKYKIIYASSIKKLADNDDSLVYNTIIISAVSSNLYLFNGRQKEANDELLFTYNKYKYYNKSFRVYFLLRRYLLSVHFACKEYSTCIKLYHELMNMDKEKISRELGFRLELVLYTEIYGVLSYLESDDVDYAFYLLNNIKRKYAKTIAQRESQREYLFIKIITKMFNDPTYLGSNQCKIDYKKFIKMKAFIPGDNEYISLNAWLTSKITLKSYYECLLAIASPTYL